MSDSLIHDIDVISHTGTKSRAALTLHIRKSLIYLLSKLRKSTGKLVKPVRQILHKRKIRLHKLIETWVTSRQTHLIPRGVEFQRKTRQIPDRT